MASAPSMSIAVSVTVKPSRLLLVMVAAMCVAVLAAGILIGSGVLGGFSLATRLTIAAGGFFLAFFGFYHTARNQKAHHIDISGIGQIRLSEARAAKASPGSCQDLNWPHVRESGEVVQLLRNSTIWSNLLLLRLQAHNGKITVVPILPDCVSRDDFRALSVACRWSAAHDNPAEHKSL